MEHTPTPWHAGIKPGPMIYGPKGEQIADMRADLLPEGENAENARFIVKAVNAHEPLVDALTLALPYVESALEDQGYKPGVVDRMVKAIREALALAESEGA